MHFAGGDGSFTATGLIALARRARRRADARDLEGASDFARRTVPTCGWSLDGDGTIALQDKRLALSGNVTVVEGHVEYDPTPTGELAPDIVIKGATPASRARSRTAQRRRSRSISTWTSVAR